MQNSGQLSLEYLILLAAALSAFAVLLPLLSQTYDAALFGLDCASARSFANGLQHSIADMSIQADGASKILEASPVGQWRLSSKEKELAIEVQGPGSASKIFHVTFPGRLHFPRTILPRQTKLRLSKSQGRILLENYKP